MHKFVLWILMICSFSAVAGVDERFASGAIGAEWGATLQEVQAAYPNGLSWPGIDKDLADTVVYEVAGDPRMLGTHTPIRLVQFSFSSENKLTRIDFHFSFSDRDNAVYDVAEMLGQDFSTTELPRGRRLTWKKRLSLLAQMTIGNSSQSPWVYLTITRLNAERQVDQHELYRH